MIAQRLAFLVLALGTAPAQDALPRTYLHQELLKRAPLVVRARQVEDKMLRRIQVTSFEVLETLRGKVSGRRVLIGAMGSRGRAFPKLEKLLFLKPMRSGRIHDLVDLIDLTESDRMVPRLLKRYVALEKEPNPVQVARIVRSLSFQGLASGSMFARRLAVRELARIAEQHPYLMTAKDLTRLEELKPRVPRPEYLRYRRTLERVNRRLASTFVGCESAFAAGKERELFLQAQGRFKSYADPQRKIRLLDEMVKTFGRKMRLFCEALLANDERAVRERAAWFLGEFGETPSVDPLVRVLESAPKAERPPFLEALGKIGDPRILPTLQVLIDNEQHIDVTLVALARVGGPEAASLLERVESRLGTEPEDLRRGERIRLLRSKEFARQETRRRQQARRIYGTDRRR